MEVMIQAPMVVAAEPGTHNDRRRELVVASANTVCLLPFPASKSLKGHDGGHTSSGTIALCAEMTPRCSGDCLRSPLQDVDTHAADRGLGSSGRADLALWKVGLPGQGTRSMSKPSVHFRNTRSHCSGTATVHHVLEAKRMSRRVLCIRKTSFVGLMARNSFFSRGMVKCISSGSLCLYRERSPTACPQCRGTDAEGFGSASFPPILQHGSSGCHLKGCSYVHAGMQRGVPQKRGFKQQRSNTCSPWIVTGIRITTPCTPCATHCPSQLLQSLLSRREREENNVRCSCDDLPRLSRWLQKGTRWLRRGGPGQYSQIFHQVSVKTRNLQSPCSSRCR